MLKINVGELSLIVFPFHMSSRIGFNKLRSFAQFYDSMQEKYAIKETFVKLQEDVEYITPWQCQCLRFANI